MKFFVSCLILLFAVASAEARPALGKPELVAPVVVDGRTDGEIWVYPRPVRADFMVHSVPLLDILSKYLPVEVLDALRLRAGGDETLSLADLETTGLSADFDEPSLELRLRIPLNLRRAWQLDLNRLKEGAPILRSERPSGYLNLRMSQTSIDRDAFFENKQPLSARADFVHSFPDVTFETGGIYQENRPAPWIRQDTRLVKDDEENLLRWTLGDLNVGTRGFQLTPNLAGVSVRREFSIRPERTAMRLSQTELLIKRDSIVDIFVNGSLYSQMRLPAGRFNLRDFPVLAGQSRVRVNIRDDLGQEESFEFDLFFEASLLEEGQHEFSYTVGMPWREAGGDRAYSTNEAMASLFHRVGVTSSLTLGANYQNYSYQHLLGFEATQATRLGTVSAEGAISEILGIAGSVGRVGWRSPDRYQGEDTNWRFGVDYERRAETFYPASPVALVSPSYLSRSDVQVSRRFGWMALAGVGSSLEEGFTGVPQRRTSRANVMLSLGRRTRLELAGFRTEQAGVKEDRGLATLSWSDEPGRYSASAYYDSLQHANAVQLTRTNQRPDRDWRGNVSYQKADGTESAGLSLEGLAPSVAARFDHFSQKTAIGDTRVSTVGLQSALVWVGTEFAISQPVNDAFVMVKAKNLPEDQSLIVNPDGQGGRAQVSGSGKTVLRELSSYTLFFVNLDTTSLPPGYLLEQEWYRIRPAYRSGLLITADFTRKVMVKGRLQMPDGTVASLVAGDLVNAQGQLVDNSFFTNRDGRFVFEGLEPGDYTLTTDRRGVAPIRFSVPADNGQVLDLGPIRLKN